MMYFIGAVVFGFISLWAAFKAGQISITSKISLVNLRDTLEWMTKIKALGEGEPKIPKGLFMNIPKELQDKADTLRTVENIAHKSYAIGYKSALIDLIKKDG